MRPVPTSVNKLVSELENIFKIDIQQKNLEFVKSINTNGIEHLLNIDQLKLKQIILNLLNNAVKHTDTGQITLSISIDNLNKSQVDLQIAVEDTGKGIPKERLKEIFKAFKQVNFSDESNGFGLGLAIVNRILDSMNGEIKVESEFGKGSKFIVTIRNINLVLKNTPLSTKSAEFDFVDKFIRRDNNLHYYSLETLQSVIVEMEGEFSRKLSKIKKNFLLNDIAAFAEQVNGIATERGVEFLTNYSNELISATKTIEVEKINYLLEDFYNLVELIRQLIEKRYGKEQRKNINSR
jgi:anti-sigma regulatory factor (Ser/Thr protein kinase)